MTPNEFDETLRLFVRREPFQPFVVEFLDGRTLDVDRPRVGFNAGSGGFVNSAEELIFFECEDVRAFLSS